MNSTTGFRITVAALLGLVLAGCFTSAPQRTGNESGSPSAGLPTPSPGGGSPSSTGGSPMPSPGGSSSSMPGTGMPGTSSGMPGTPGTPSSMPGSTGRSSSSGDTMPSGRSARSGSESGADGRTGGQDGSQDIRVATAERPGQGDADGSSGQTGADGSASDGRQVSAAEALEAANAAVDAAADAVGDAEATIERAREAVLTEQQGGAGDSFDPWATPAQDSAASDSSDGGGDTQADEAATDGQRSGGGEESFDPFATYGGGGGSDGQPSQRQLSEGSLQIADDALATANAALNRARRSLIEAAVAGGGDADAEAVQLAAARAALEAAAEAVVASAIAVMAAAASMEPVGEPITDPEEIQRAMEEFAAGLAMVVGVLHREMTSAADALEATADLLTAAGSLIAMVGQADLERRDHDEGPSAGERVASLDEQLDESLAVFDDRMNAEGAAIEPGLPGGDGRSGAASTGGGSDPRSASAASTSGDMAGWGSGDRPMNRREGEWARNDNSAERWKKPTPAPDDVEDFVGEESDPQDDDIVARQLREAAAAESDPQLREKLWEEYYAYKESLERGEAETTQ